MSEKKKENILTGEDIEKAFDQLEEEASLLDSEEDFEKGDDDEINDEDFEDSEDDEEDEESEDEDIEKANKGKMSKKKKAKDDDDEDDDDDYEDEDDEDTEKANEDDFNSYKDEIKKGIEVSGFLKGIVSDIEKSNQETKSALANVAKILTSLSKRIDDVEESLEKAIQNPRQKKSRVGKEQIIDKFEKGESGEFEKANEGKVVLGMTKDYQSIINLLDAKAFGNNGNEFKPEFAKALTSLETVKSIPADIVARINKEDNIIITSEF